MICKNCGREIPKDVERCPVCNILIGLEKSKDPDINEIHDTSDKNESGAAKAMPAEVGTLEEDISVAESIKMERNDADTESSKDTDSLLSKENLANGPEKEEEITDASGKDDDDMSRAFALFEEQMNAATETGTETGNVIEETGSHEDVSAMIEDDIRQDKDSAESEEEHADSDPEKAAASSDTTGDKISKDIGEKNPDGVTKDISAETITDLVKWDAFILAISIILSSLGGISGAVIIGLLMIAAIDFVIVQRARIGKTKKNEKGANVKFAVIAAIAIMLTCVGSYLIAPANTVMRLIEAKDTGAAKEIVETKIKGRSVQEKLFDRNIDRYYKSVIEDYNGGKLDDTGVKEELNPLIEIMDSEESDKIAAFIASIDAYNQGKVFYDNGNYIEAISLLSKVVKDHQKYQDAQDMIEKAKEKYKEDLFAKVGNPDNLDKCVSALELLEEASDALQDDTEIKQKQDEIKTVYITLLDKEVNDRVNDFDYEGALDIVNKARGLVGEDETISKLQSLVSSIKPEPLSSYHVINGGNVFQQDCVDTYGNKYNKNNCIVFTVYSVKEDNSYVTFNIGPESKHIRGTIAVYDSSWKDFECTLHILSDNGELYTERISRDTKPISIDLDVSDTETLTFRADDCEGYGHIILGNIMVY